MTSVSKARLDVKHTIRNLPRFDKFKYVLNSVKKSENPRAFEIFVAVSTNGDLGFGSAPATPHNLLRPVQFIHFHESEQPLDGCRVI